MVPRRDRPTPRNGHNDHSSDTGDVGHAFAQFVSRVRDYAIFMLDRHGTILTWNEGAERIKGYHADEIIGKHIAVFYTPEDRARGLPDQLLKTADVQGRVEEENWRVRKNGTRFWADVVITAVRDEDGNLTGFGKVTRDLTERKEAETALAELAGRLLRVQDDERRQLARDLHDTTSPAISALMMRLHRLRQRAMDRRDPVDETVIREAITQSDAVTAAIRSVATVLHPPLLEQSGLLASLRWFLQAYGSRTGARIDADLPQALERLPHDLEIALFRVVQECVSNVAREVSAKRTQVTLTAGKGDLKLTIKLEAQLPSVAVSRIRHGRGEAGIGLAGLRERLRQFGGRIDVVENGDHVSIQAVVPVAPPARG
jgi:PAS domain S-box-containing protein